MFNGILYEIGTSYAPRKIDFLSFPVRGKKFSYQGGSYSTTVSVCKLEDKLYFKTVSAGPKRTFVIAKISNV